MKDKAKAVVDSEKIEPELEMEPGYDDMTAECHACGESHVGVGVPVYMIVPGMLFPSRSFDVATFVPDPDVKMTTLQLPNGQLSFVTDQETTKYAHIDCIDVLIDDAGNEPGEDDEEDEDDEAEEIEIEEDFD